MLRQYRKKSKLNISIRESSLRVIIQIASRDQLWVWVYLRASLEATENGYKPICKLHKLQRRSESKESCTFNVDKLCESGGGENRFMAFWTAFVWIMNNNGNWMYNVNISQAFSREPIDCQ